MRVMRQNSAIIANIDFVDTSQIAGWAMDKKEPQNRLYVEVYYKDQLLCAVCAASYRKELADAGMGDGYYAFIGLFEKNITNEQLNDICICLLHKEPETSCQDDKEHIACFDQEEEHHMPKKYNVAIVAIVKNEASYIMEWIAYHRMVGIDHFFLYDNASSDETGEMLKYLAKCGIVTLVYWPNRPNVNLQVAAYEHAVFHFRRDCEWLAIIDADEMIVPVHVDSIGAGLNEFENESGLAINWKVFGSSGQLTKQKGLVMERFTRCSSSAFVNRHVKTIANVERLECPDIHISSFYSGNLVDENFGVVASPVHSRVSYEKFQINHYFTKSREEWKVKRERGKADRSEGSEDKYRLDSEFDAHDLNDEEDKQILRFLHKTKQEIMNLNKQIQMIAFQEMDIQKLKVITKGRIVSLLPKIRAVGYNEDETKSIWIQEAKVQNAVAQVSLVNQQKQQAVEVTSNYFQKCSAGYIYKQSVQIAFNAANINPEKVQFLYYGENLGYIPVITKWIKLDNMWWYGESYYHCIQSDEIRLMNLAIPNLKFLENPSYVFIREPEWISYAVAY